MEACFVHLSLILIMHGSMHRVDIKFSNLISFREEVSIHFLWLLTAPKRFTMCLSVLAPSGKTILSLLV